MDAIARPGCLKALKLPEHTGELEKVLGGPLATLVSIFIDQAVTFAIAAEDAAGLSDTIAAETHAWPTTLDQAAFAILPHGTNDRITADALAAVSAGSLISPEMGATVLIGCERLVSSDHEVSEHDEFDSLQWVSIEGPGVKDAHVFGIDCAEWAWARNRRADEFPCGIDIVLADKLGQVVAIPRTSFVSLLAVGKKAI